MSSGVTLTIGNKDFTEVLREGWEIGGKGIQGEADVANLTVNDEAGTFNDSSLSPGEVGKQVVLRETGTNTVLARGRVVIFGTTRPYITEGGVSPDRQIDWKVQVEDANRELRGIDIATAVRPQETDVARVLWVLNTYLSGSPRATTVIADTYVPNTNTVTLDAKTYRGTDPYSIISDCAVEAGKRFFVTSDMELFYDLNTSTAYAAGLAISDRLSELNSGVGCGSGTPIVLSSGSSNNYGSSVSCGPLTSGGISVPEGATIVAGFIRTTAGTSTGCSYNPNPADAVAPNLTLTKIASASLTNAPADGSVYGELWVLEGAAASYGGGGQITASSDAAGEKILGYQVLDRGTVNHFATASGHMDSAQPSVTVSSTANDLVCEFFGVVGPYGGIDISGADPSPATKDWDEDGLTSFGLQGILGFGSHVTATGASTGIAWSGVPNNGDEGSYTVADPPWVDLAVSITATGTGACVMPPVWDGDTPFELNGQSLDHGVRLWYGNDQSVLVTDPAVLAAHDYFIEQVFDDQATNSAAATRRANAVLQERKFGQRTYNVSVRLLPSQVGLLKYGQTVQIKARAIVDADDAAVTRRIGLLRWTHPGDDVFYAHMQLEVPTRWLPHDVAGAGSGSPQQTSVKVQTAIADAIPFANPGDMLYYGSNGSNTRLAIGASNTHLTSDGSIPHWLPYTDGSVGGGMANPMTAVGDIIRGDTVTGGVAAPARLAIGASNTRLASDGVVPLWVPKDALTASITVQDEGTPLSTSADTLNFTGAGVTASGTGTTKTINIPGGGGGTSLPLDVAPGSASSWDDEFPGSSLDVKWTNPLTSAASQNLTLAVASDWLTFEPATAGSSDTGKHVFGIRQNGPTGDFTVMAKIQDGRAGDDARAGIFVAKTGGKAYVLGSQRQNGRTANFNGVTTYSESADWSAYDGALDIWTSPAWPGNIWLKLEFASGTLNAYYSVGGVVWTFLGSQGSVTQPDRIGLCLWANSATLILADHLLICDWFRVTEP